MQAIAGSLLASHRSSRAPSAGQAARSSAPVAAVARSLASLALSLLGPVVASFLIKASGAFEFREQALNEGVDTPGIGRKHRAARSGRAFSTNGAHLPITITCNLRTEFLDSLGVTANQSLLGSLWPVSAAVHE